MLGLIPVLIVIALLATLGVLLFGVITMARGGDFNAKYSNKLMRARVICQFVAIALIVIFMLIGGKG
jgi:hypothetical protein